MENKIRPFQENNPLLLITQHINKNKKIHCTYQTLKDIYCHLLLMIYIQK